MKNKKLLYLLLPLVLLVWGMIFYRVFRVTPGAPPDEIKYTHAEKKPPAGWIKSLPDTIAVNYPDPFLKKYIDAPVKETVKKEAKVTVPKKVVPKAPPVNWADLRFYGTTRNEASGTTLAMVAFRGSGSSVREQETVGDFTVKKIGKNFLTVLRGDSTHTYYTE